MKFMDKTEALGFVAKHRALFDRAEESNPFAGSAWTAHFIEQAVAPDWRFIDQAAAPDWRFVALEAPEAGALMLLCANPRQPRRLLALANFYTSLLSPVIGPAEAHGELLAQLAGLRPRIETIDLAPVDLQALEVAALRRRLAAAGWYCREYFCFGNWHLPCAGQRFADYMAERPAQLHNTWQRKRKLFSRPGARLEIVTGPEGLEAALAAYERVYARSWKTPERHPDFVPGWARICAQRGWLRLGLAWVEDTPVAAQFWFVMHGRAYIFKLAYDENYGRWSAGTVLTAHLIEHCLERDKVVEIDFLTGDDAYKSAWMKARRERKGLIACNLRTPGGLLAAAAQGLRAARDRWPSRPVPPGPHTAPV